MSAIDRLSSWARWVRARFPRRPAWGGVVFACSLVLPGCAEPLVHQRGLAALHTQAAQQCKATPASCAPLQVCAAGLRASMTAWQSVSTAIAAGDDETELARTADALISEGTARAACLVAMPPTKRSK